MPYTTALYLVSILSMNSVSSYVINKYSHLLLIDSRFYKLAHVFIIVGHIRSGQEYNSNLPGDLSLHLKPHFPRLVTMVAMFLMLGRNVNNSIYYSYVIQFLVILFLLITMVNNTIC